MGGAQYNDWSTCLSLCGSTTGCNAFNYNIWSGRCDLRGCPIGVAGNPSGSACDTISTTCDDWTAATEVHNISMSPTGPVGNLSKGNSTLPTVGTSWSCASGTLYSDDDCVNIG